MPKATAAKLAVFIFHRDLRIKDNTALIQARRDGYTILPIFIFTPEQIDRSKNPFFSNPAVQFMCESLIDLATTIPLRVFEGDTLEILDRLHTDLTYNAIYFNEDYSVYAVARDTSIREFCATKRIECVATADYGLVPDTVRPYFVFAPFYKKVMATALRSIDKTSVKTKHFADTTIAHALPIAQIGRFYEKNDDARIRGGRHEGKQMLRRLKTLTDYQTERDYPALNKTSLASPHLKFGTVSIREMYHKIAKAFGTDHGLIRELIFRDFYLKIYSTHPQLQRGHAYDQTIDKNIEWSKDTALFEKWQTGQTGFPLVDAGMCEMNATGHQHNRIRMLCANVLTKYFLIDWRWGLKYYYTHLVDADIFSNTAGWQWASSTGPSAIPYYRPPFNPYIQSKKYDKDATYIKKWLPELEKVSATDIHNWFKPAVREKYPTTTYPAPVIDHTLASKRAVTAFKSAYTKS